MPNSRIVTYAPQPAIFTATTKEQVVFVGRRRLQLESTARYLAGVIPLDITWVPSQEALALHNLPDGPSPELIICDWLDVRDNGLTRFKALVNAPERPFYALINVERDQLLEKNAIDAGFRGIFYDDDSPQVLTRGVSALLASQLWYSREVMSQVLLGHRQTRNESEKSDASSVTPREMEILACMKRGFNNAEIAKQLGISQNTVRTHICNIFAKINVPNRVQAILWVAKNLHL